MALNQINTPTVETFKNEIQQSASQLNSIYHANEDIAEFLNQFTALSELADVGVTETEAQDIMIEYRTVLNEMVAFFNGTGTTQTIVPATVIDKIRRMK